MFGFHEVNEHRRWMGSPPLTPAEYEALLADRRRHEAEQRAREDARLAELRARQDAFSQPGQDHAAWARQALAARFSKFGGLGSPTAHAVLALEAAVGRQNALLAELLAELRAGRQR